jgi:hypothetical protein
MEYLGGTYISQVEAGDKEQARELWIRDLKVEEIEAFTIADKEDIIKENFADEDITPIAGMKNVWFFMVETKKGYGYVNVINTKL